jgi:nitrate/nitrite-specific signal transduction histidine kinase
MGLRIMGYRAGMIGASLEVRPGRGKGTSVICNFKCEPPGSLE